jgi:hypothetical protein
LINRVLDQFNEEERKRIGVHTCPGGDRDSTVCVRLTPSGGGAEFLVNWASDG